MTIPHPTAVFIDEILAAKTPMDLASVVERIEASSVTPGGVLFLRGAVALRTRELIIGMEPF